MVNHICTKCQKSFSRKSDYIYHTEKKKNPCRPDLQIFADICRDLQESTKNDTNSCTHCKKNFSSVYTLNRHLNNYCKAKKKFDKEKDKQDNQIEELKKLILEQSKQIEQLKKHKSSKITINNTTTNNTDNSVKNNVNNNIKLQAHGSEDLSKIELKTILTHLTTQDFVSIVPKLTKEIFRNKKRPEFLNFEILDLARNKSRYYDGENWVTGNADDGAEKVFENVNSVILEPFEKKNIYKTIRFIEKDDELSEKAEWINWGKNFCGKLFTEDDKEYVEHKEKICDNIKNLMYSIKCEQIKK